MYRSFMAMGETSIGGSRRDFPSTSWNLIRGVGKAHRDQLERLIYLYWKPAYLYLRASGRKSVEDAKDPSESSRFLKGELEGITYADVAAKLGLRESDVRKRLARCRAVLREIVLERIRDYSTSEDEVMTEFEKIVRG